MIDKNVISIPMQVKSGLSMHLDAREGKDALAARRIWVRGSEQPI